MLDKRKSFIMSVAERKDAIKSVHEADQANTTKGDNSRTAAIILSIGLLIHNIFEGMSIGLSPDSTKLMIIMIAVCSHKVITAFSLGLSF